LLRLFQEYAVVAYSERLAEYGGAQFRVTGIRNNGGRPDARLAVPRQQRREQEQKQPAAIR
jgi:hypothetical protein